MSTSLIVSFAVVSTFEALLKQQNQKTLGRWLRTNLTPRYTDYLPDEPNSRDAL
jgi:hypothetical protein